MSEKFTEFKNTPGPCDCCCSSTDHRNNTLTLKRKKNKKKKENKLERLFILI